VGFKGDDGENGAEGLLAHQAHGGRESGDEGGRVEVGAEIGERPAAGEDSGSESAGFFDLAGDDLELGLGDERANVGIRERAVAYFELGDFVLAEVEEAGIERVVDVAALDR